jgi:hypothetical protein
MALGLRQFEETWMLIGGQMLLFLRFLYRWRPRWGIFEVKVDDEQIVVGIEQTLCHELILVNAATVTILRYHLEGTLWMLLGTGRPL